MWVVIVGESKPVDALDGEDLGVLSYLRAERPDLEGPFLGKVRRARRGILHRLLQAVVREDVAGISDRVHREKSLLEIRLSGGRRVAVPAERTFSFGRFDLDGDAVLLDGEGREVIEHPARLLDLLVDEGVIPPRASPPQLAGFRQELRNSAANYALSLAGWELRRRELAALAREAGARTSLEWARTRAAEDDRFSPLVFYEQLVVDGHPLHPGAKLKLGLGAQEAIRYSPEFGAAPEARLVAVGKERCVDMSLDGRGVTAILCEEHPRLCAYVEDALRRRGLDADSRALIPVHPWQFERTLPGMYAGAIAGGEVVPLEEVRIATRALMTFRTLAPARRSGHHIKTAVNLRLTGAVRTVSAGSVENSTEISRVLREVKRKEEDFGARFAVLEERAGAYYDPSGGGHLSEERGSLRKNLAAILRENPENHAGPGEVSMPASALLAESPVSGGPVLAEAVGEFARERGIHDLKAAAVLFARRYCEVCLPGFLTLLSRYGISVEGHLQNAVPVFRGGEPVRMLVRDFGGVRILRERLLRQGIQAGFYHGSAIVSEDVEDLRNKSFYPVFQNHLGELIACLVRCFDLEEKQLWRPVAGVCREVFAELKRDPAVREQAAGDEEALFRPELDLKAMTTMRLLGDVTDYTFSKVPNPMFRAESR